MMINFRLTKRLENEGCTDPEVMMIVQYSPKHALLLLLRFYFEYFSDNSSLELLKTALIPREMHGINEKLSTFIVPCVIRM